MNKTLIIVILDESGSMHANKIDMIDGYNSFINNQKMIKCDNARFYLIKFNTDVNVALEAVNLSDVPAMTNNDFIPCGGTALYDAISKGVELAENAKLIDENVICLIITDGEENSSSKTSKADVKKLISKHEEEGDWAFYYIGEKPDQWAFETGTKKKHSVQFNHSNPKTSMDVADCVVSGIRTSTNQCYSKKLF